MLQLTYLSLDLSVSRSYPHQRTSRALLGGEADGAALAEGAWVEAAAASEERRLGQHSPALRAQPPRRAAHAAARLAARAALVPRATARVAPRLDLESILDRGPWFSCWGERGGSKGGKGAAAHSAFLAERKSSPTAEYPRMNALKGPGSPGSIQATGIDGHERRPRSRKARPPKAGSPSLD